MIKHISDPSERARGAFFRVLRHFDKIGGKLPHFFQVDLTVEANSAIISLNQTKGGYFLCLVQWKVKKSNTMRMEK